jgi:hypothetical protein
MLNEIYLNTYFRTACVLLCIGVGSQYAVAQNGGGHSELLFQWAGDSGEDFASKIAVAGDVDRDGFDDVLVGNPFGRGDVSLFSGANGQLLYQWYGTDPFYDFGYAVSGAGDFNADGIPDVVIGSRKSGPGRGDLGAIFVYSGVDGSLLFEKSSSSSNDNTFGRSLACAGDVNGDGYDDIIVGEFDNNYWNSSGTDYINGRVKIISGVSGDLIHSLSGWSQYNNFGYAVSGAGDVDQDGFDDFIVGSPESSRGYSGSRVVLYSGFSGTALHWLWEPRTQDDFGQAVAGGHDMNKDGYNDIVVGANDAQGDWPDQQRYGKAYAYSGQTGELLFDWLGPHADSFFGASVALASDLNGDGYADVLVGAPQHQPKDQFGPGSVFAYSGADGSLLWRWDGEADGDQFGSSVTAADLEADGYSEVLIGAPKSDTSSATDCGGAFLYSFAPLIQADQSELSASLGGVLNLSIDFPDNTRGYNYAVLASVNGTGPTRIGVPIPLTWGRLMMNTMFGLYPIAIHSDLQGQLDSKGRAHASMTFAPGETSSVIGRTIHFAAIAVQPGRHPEYSSVAVPLTITP